MIVRETETSFIYLHQHDHAYISGELATQWRSDYFIGPERRADTELAIYQHDRGWINLDATPIWNNKTAQPYSFIDYPVPPKVVHYKQGLDEVEALSAYATLLCSLHYTSFTGLLHQESGRVFLASEEIRQQKLREQLKLNYPEAEETIKFQVQLLKFCDDLSLYLCLNEPGAAKENEYPWYKAGLPHSDQFLFTNQQLIQATWLTKNEVNVSPFPFKQEFTTTLRYQELKKTAIKQLGLAHCFAQAPQQELAILIRP